LPRTSDSGHVSLSAEPAFRSDFARDTSNFAGERIELIHHRVNGVFQQKNFATDVYRDLLGQVAGCNRRGNFDDVTHLASQVAGHRVHRVGEILPRTGDTRYQGLSAETAVGPDFTGDTRNF